MKRLLLVIATVGTLNAQQLLFRTSVDTVRVDVVVTDSDDRPVTNLTKTDFSITESKRPQTITDFQFVSVPVEYRTIDVTQPQPQPPEPDVATNMPPTPQSRLFVMVIDDLHLIEQDIIPIKRVITDFITALSPDDEVALVFVGRSDLSVNFTQNTGRLLATIDHVREALGFGLDALAHVPISDPSGGFLTGPSPLRLNYARSAAMTLRNVAASLAGSGHSRRAIVYVSGGTTLDPFDAGAQNYSSILGDELQLAFDTARRADVPIYTLDPRGLASPEDSVRGGIGALQSEGTRRLVAGNIKTQQTYLSEIAINTGGRAFTNASDLKRAVQDIVGENGSYYLLSYSPDPVVHDGKYHGIGVTVTRPGLHVRAREGYVASAAGPATTDAKPTLDKAMSAGVNVSGLSLRAFVLPIVPTAKGMNAVVTVEVTYPAPVDGSRKIDDQLQMNLVAMDPDANVKAQASQALHFTGTVPVDQDSVTFLVDEAVALPSQPLTVRVGMASQALGKAGTVQFAVDVVAPSASKLQLSGVLVGFSGGTREAVMRADTIKDLVPFQPTTTRTFSATDTLRIFGRAFWGTKDAAVDVTLTIQGSTAAPQVLHLTVASGSAAHREGVIDTTLPLAGLAPGSYTLRIDAHLPSGQTAHRDVLFVVLSPVLVAGEARPIPVIEPQAPTVAALLEQVGAYLVDYEKQFAGVASEEHYTQTMRKGTGNMVQVTNRTLQSDVIVINTGGESWAVFRDVVAVDGTPVRDRDERLQKLFVETPGQALVQAQKIADEGARYNLGSVQRNINVPTMALTYLRAANQARSTFVMTGRESVGSLQAIILGFKEVASPTVIRSTNQDLPATGRFWIDPDTGRVVKSELSVNGKVSQTRITVTYAPAQTLPVWVPAAMDEEYTNFSGTERVTTQAKYSNFHQFKVSTGVIIK